MGSVKSIAWAIPAVFFAITTGVSAFQSGPLYTLIFLVGFSLLYLLSVPKAAKIAKLGNKTLALKTAIGAFVPLIGTLNTAVYKVINSDLFKHYLSTAETGSRDFRNWLVMITPEYGNIIYFGLIGIIVVGINLIMIRKFVSLAKNLCTLAALKAVA